MSRATKTAVFELLRFHALPVTADVAIVELEGRFARGSRFARRPQLVVEGLGERALELPPADEAEIDGRWRGTFAVPAAALEEGGFALGVRGALLELPAPDLADGADRLAALAREANALRRRLEAAEDEAARLRATAEARLAATVDDERATSQAAAAEADQRAAAAQRALAEARTEAHEARLAADAEAARRAQEVEAEASRRIHEAESEAARLREALEAALGTQESERAHAASAAIALETRLADVEARLERSEAEARDLRRQLKSARAEAEAARREQERPRRPAIVPVAEPGAGAGDDDAAGTAPPKDPAVDADPDPAGAGDPGAGDEPTRTLPTATRDTARVIDLDASWPAEDAATVEDRGSVESVKVLGRAPRRVDPVPPVPEGARLPARTGPERYVAVVVLLIALVIVAVIVATLV